MNGLVAAAWTHGNYGYHHGVAHGGDWIVNMVISSVVHGLIYGIIFRLLNHLSFGQMILLAVVVIGGLWLWNRNRGYRSW